MSKTAKVLAHLKSGHSITPLQAIGLYSAYRLADIVFKARKRGLDIQTHVKRDPNGSAYAEYFIPQLDV